MNRLPLSAATAGGVVTGYVSAGPKVSHARKDSRKRKRGYPGFRVRMADFYVEEIRAIVECMGGGVSQFVYHALLEAARKAADSIGMSLPDIANLNKRERLEIRRKFRLSVAAQTAQTFRPELN